MSVSVPTVDAHAPGAAGARHPPESAKVTAAEASRPLGVVDGVTDGVTVVEGDSDGEADTLLLTDGDADTDCDTDGLALVLGVGLGVGASKATRPLPPTSEPAGAAPEIMGFLSLKPAPGM